MEKIESNEIDIFENDIDMCLHLFQEEQNIDNMRAISQSVWNGFLIFTYRRLFKGTNLLKENIKNDYYFNYNFDKINNLVNYYIYLCTMFDKEISIMGFSYLTGIDTDTINQWKYYKDTNKASAKLSVIYEKLNKGRVESLANKLATGKQNPVGVIAILNHYYNWSSPYTSDANRTAAARIARNDVNVEPKALESPPDTDISQIVDSINGID